ncbi:MAG: UvrD-helicase domain-containing protein [Bdellovibrionales bacterium]|nr:UvrD-helicase domain-containing protein [Ramlibacter sp.]
MTDALTRPQQPAYRRGDAAVARDAFYALACDPRRSVAVEACAGAGKTWMLVSRILRALLEGARPHEILAITFTKKAAGEMRERLHDWLAEYANASRQELIDGLTARGIARPDDAQLDALKGLYRGILVAGRPVQIRTFHSWFAALLRTAPLAVLHELELPSAYELLEDDAPAKALVWRRLFTALVKAAELRRDFEDAVASHGRSQTLKALEAALDKRIEFALADAQGVIENSVKTFASQFKGFEGLETPGELLWASEPARKLMASAAIALGQAKAPTFSAKGSELEQALTDGDLDGVFSALLTNEGTARKFGDKLEGIALIREAQDLVLQIVQARHQHEAWLHQQRMARLTRLLLSEFAALKRQRGWVDMNDVERASLRLLNDPALSGWVQERLDARVRHLLIDEFQDTNPLQWQALHAWLASYTGAGNAPSVFIVGDPKQSIYRFRRAEPQVFRAAQAFIAEGLGGELLSCDHTRRNSLGVVASVNEVMGRAATEDGYESFRPHTTESRAQGQVLRLPQIPRGIDPLREPDDGPDEHTPWRDSLTVPRELPEETLALQEGRQAARWIAAQIALGREPAQIMVLARRRSALAPVLGELRALRIPALMGEKTDLIECCEVQDMVALLDALVSPQHDLSLARALRSPLFALSDDDLVQIALRQRALREAGEPSTWWSVLQQPAVLPAHLQALGPVLRQWRSWLDALPPHDALDAIYHHGDVLARFSAAAPAVQRESVLANLQALLGASLQIDGARYATPYGFVRALKAAGVQAPATVNRDAVQLLTVHGAKGLEAGAILLVDTDTPERNAETMNVLVDWPGEAAWPLRFVFMVSETRPPPCCAGLLAAEQNARRREELNGLYVAMTRARETLAVSAIEPHRASAASWWQRLQALATPARGADLNVAPQGAASVAPTEFLMAVLPPAPPEAVIATSPDGAPPSAAQSAIGEAMHRLLQWASLESATFSETHLRAAAREFGLTQVQSRIAGDIAQRILGGNGAWAWKPQHIEWHGNEVALSHGGKSLRLDRLVRRTEPPQWWVLDYKSASHPQNQAELVQQMRIYRDAVQAIHPGEVVKAAFLTGQGEMIEIE